LLLWLFWYHHNHRGILSQMAGCPCKSVDLMAGLPPHPQPRVKVVAKKKVDKIKIPPEYHPRNHPPNPKLS